MVDVLLLILGELFGSTPFYIPILAATLFGIGLHVLQKKYSYPRYMLKTAVISAAAVFVFSLMCICMELLSDAETKIPASRRDIQRVGVALLAAAVISVLVVLAVLARALSIYLGYQKKLQEMIRCTKTEDYDYSPIAGWRVLESLPPSRLTRRQRENYEKYRIYLRMLLGNFNGVESELEKLQEKDKAYYHFLKYVQCTAMGHMEEASREIQQAQENGNADTNPLIMGQIMLNRGVGYVGIGLYEAADDAFVSAIRYCNKNRVKEKVVWKTLYYDYVFNRIRLEPKMKRPKWEQLLEPLKDHLDMKNPKDYMAFSNMELELLRQTNACREEINENIYESFAHLMRSEIPIKNRCMLEASFARMVWSAMGDPTDVLRMLERDRKHLLELPMPARYNCFHQIDIFFTDLHGGIVEQYDRLRQSAFWYMMTQAQQDLEEYRRSLPAEAVYEKCFCLMELAGRCKKNSQEYRWDEVMCWVKTAIALYRENGLELEEILCELNAMDEATSPLNMDQDLELTKRDEMERMLEKIEEAIPKFEKHPIMAEIALRLSFYCSVMHDYDRCRKYFEVYQHLCEIVSLWHFAPWIQRYYMVTGFTVRVLYFLDAVRAIRKEIDEQEEITLADEWFLHFYERNGAFESIVLAMVLGIEDGMLLKTKLWPLAEGEDFCKTGTAAGLAEHLWLYLPQLGIEIDVTYSRFVQDAKKDRVIFNQGHHPIEQNQSGFLRRKRLDLLPMFAPTYVQVIGMSQLPQEQQEALRVVYNRIMVRLPRECPSMELLRELYRMTMLPVGI